MSDSDIIPFGASVASDILSAFQIPGGGTLAYLGAAYLNKKRQEAANILIEEVAKGSEDGVRFDKHDVDPLIDIVFRFSKAVADGAARENLRLLAKIIVGLKKFKALEADKFRKWSGILEDLTRDELMVIGKAYAIRSDIISRGPGAPNDFWQRLQDDLKTAGYDSSQILALCASLTRTGLFQTASAFSGIAYMDTAWLLELGQLADVESVLK